MIPLGLQPFVVFAHLTSAEHCITVHNETDQNTQKRDRSFSGEERDKPNIPSLQSNDLAHHGTVVCINNRAKVGIIGILTLIIVLSIISHKGKTDKDTSRGYTTPVKIKFKGDESDREVSSKVTKSGALGVVETPLGKRSARIASRKSRKD
eukprot:scaffold135107_cov49-Attheya_sp.AAC.1